jgi:periplasmic copper chaperone A
MRAALRPAAFFAAPAVRLAFRAFALAVIGLVAWPSFAHDYKAGSLRIDHPYARPTPPGARTGAVYFTVHNDGREADRLVKVASPVAQSTELHSMTMEGSLMKMRPAAALDIPPGGSVTLGASGYHAMLVGLAHPLAAGDRLPLTLTFEKAGRVQVFATVEAANGTHKH